MGKHRHNTRTLSGVVLQHNFSPKGDIEGFVLDTDTGPVQVNFPHGPEAATHPAPAQGSRYRVEVTDDHHAAKHDPGDHPVYEFVANPDAGPDQSGVTTVEGVVARLNYARHGEPNGVVLDSGDFVHMKPHGMHRVPLKIGSHVVAEGPVRATVTGHRVVEARAVNGIAIAHGKPPH
ncbi:hypothetical protein [Frigoriglobus tundricola]|uniref:Uncharacterized protein n=1 Tax=Frigoriglobus tundricola TaxID=2774151 RepID=A0A6M5Z2U4_9BACT|nr:hypothetical protein [Frigoriglobus tundricola]QJW99870.1 hypothetical protein FTUN_7493 [Frigoriglobus tundricola]